MANKSPDDLKDMHAFLHLLLSLEILLKSPSSKSHSFILFKVSYDKIFILKFDKTATIYS